MRNSVCLVIFGFWSSSEASLSLSVVSLSFSQCWCGIAGLDTPKISGCPAPEGREGSSCMPWMGAHASAAIHASGTICKSWMLFQTQDSFCAVQMHLLKKHMAHWVPHERIPAKPSTHTSGLVPVGAWESLQVLNHCCPPSTAFSLCCLFGAELPVRTLLNWIDLTAAGTCSELPCTAGLTLATFPRFAAFLLQTPNVCKRRKVLPALTVLAAASCAAELSSSAGSEEELTPVSGHEGSHPTWSLLSPPHPLILCWWNTWVFLSFQACVRLQR